MGQCMGSDGMVGFYQTELPLVTPLEGCPRRKPTVRIEQIGPRKLRAVGSPFGGTYRWRTLPGTGHKLDRDTGDVVEFVGNEGGPVQVTVEYNSDWVFASDSFTIELKWWHELARERWLKDPIELYHRNVGVEIEIAEWEAQKPRDIRLLNTHDVLVEPGGEGWELQAELSGRLEFVMKEPYKETVPALDTVIGSIQTYGAYLHQQFDVASPQAAVNLRGGKDGYFLHKNTDARPMGQFQATVGVHLAGFTDLFRQSGEADNTVPNLELVVRWVEAFKDACWDADLKLPLGPLISPELEGLSYLIFYYLMQGHYMTRSPFPKGLAHIMARTSFGRMFRCVPEADYFAQHPDRWIELVCGAAKLDSSEYVFEGEFDPRTVPPEQLYKETQRVPVTREKWLGGMTEGKDYLSQADSPELPILKTMGSLGEQTDAIGFEFEGALGMIVELRNMLRNYAIADWTDLTLKVRKFVHALNRPMSARDNREAATEIRILAAMNSLPRQAEEGLRRLAEIVAKHPVMATCLGLAERAHDVVRRCR